VGKFIIVDGKEYQVVPAAVMKTMQHPDYADVDDHAFFNDDEADEQVGVLGVCFLDYEGDGEAQDEPRHASYVLIDANGRQIGEGEYFSYEHPKPYEDFPALVDGLWDEAWRISRAEKGSFGNMVETTCRYIQSFIGTEAPADWHVGITSDPQGLLYTELKIDEADGRNHTFGGVGSREAADNIVARLTKLGAIAEPTGQLNEAEGFYVYAYRPNTR
jgi:hypothetical protein